MGSEELALKIRQQAIEMTHQARASHLGSILSIADIVGVLFSDVLTLFPDDPQNDERDRLILSKGHAGVAIYVALAEKGFFPKKDLKTYYQNGSLLSGHISHKGIKGVELSTGSLGHGACVACGMALAAQIDHKKHKVIAIIGDGECEEGSIWEMALFAHHYRLSNLFVIVDNNNMQSLDTCDNTLSLNPLADKWKAFGWKAIEVDGHNHEQLRQAFHQPEPDKPTCIVAHTVKGKGVSFMENDILWHYKDPQGDFYTKALEELGVIK